MTTPQPSEAPKLPPGTSRSMTVVSLLLGGVLALIGATQTWVTATGFEAAHVDREQLSGQEASPVIPALSPGTIAAGAALSSARKSGRGSIGGVAVIAAATVCWATITVMTNPLDAVALKIAETTGTTDFSVAAAQLELSVLPWLTLVGSLIAVIGGVITLAVGGRWPVGKTKKYDVGEQKQTTQNGRLDEIDTWDELSRGEDPT